MQSEKPQEQQNELFLRGIVERIKFQNPDNGYTVFTLKVTGEFQPYTVVGTMPGLTSGAHIVVRGYENSHSKYGKQISARSICEDSPSSASGIERFLASGAIKGIGEKTAEILVNEFGEQTIDKIVDDFEAVASIPGIGKSKALKLREALLERKSVNQVLQFLIENGLSPNLAAKIYQKYGNSAVETLKNDPYVLSREMQGIGFKKSDTIALGLGFSLAAPQRIKAALYYTLEKSLDDGHCFLKSEQLISMTAALLGEQIEADLESIDQQLKSLLMEGYVVLEQDRYYLNSIFKAEEFVAGFIAERSKLESTLQIPDVDVRNAISLSEEQLQIEFSAEQKSTLTAAQQKRLMIITGGPGCGKTTIVRALSKLFQLSNKRLSLAAPTGRAAQRMSQVCATDASTIHRLLKFDPFTKHFWHTANNPLEVDAVIVDEASMIDIQLAKSLFAAIPLNATLILVGDKDQLPSVGPGKLLQDLVSIKELTVIGLTRLYRREGTSHINEIAHLVNSGNAPVIPEPNGKTKTDAYLIEKKHTSDALKVIESLFSKQLTEKFGFSHHQILILTPTNRGDLGTESLNKSIQEAVNPLNGRQQLIVGNMVLRAGDRVCQRVNNYQIDDYGVFNGDIGTVIDIDAAANRAQVELWDGRIITYQSADLAQLSLAYALTIHRSQGSEIPCVIMVLHESHFKMLERQLVYTGITRAKKLLVIVGTKSALKIATQRAQSLKRQTALVERINSDESLRDPYEI